MVVKVVVVRIVSQILIISLVGIVQEDFGYQGSGQGEKVRMEMKRMSSSLSFSVQWIGCVEDEMIIGM